MLLSEVILLGIHGLGPILCIRTTFYIKFAIISLYLLSTKLNAHCSYPAPCQSSPIIQFYLKIFNSFPTQLNLQLVILYFI